MAFPDDPLELRLELLIAGQWVDVTGSLVDQQVSIARGRSDEAADPQPASMGFVLDNPDGDWTPNRAQSPWWPHIRRGVRCRFSVRWDGEWHVRFFGDAAAWAPEWPLGDNVTATQPAESRVSVTAAGVLRRLTQGQKPLHSPLHRRVMSVENPRVFGYWPLEDNEHVFRASSPVEGVNPMFFGGDAFSFGSSPDPPLPGGGDVVHIQSGRPAGWWAHLPPVTVPRWRVDWFGLIKEPPESGFFPLMVVDTADATTARWAVDLSSSTLRLRGFSAGGSTQFTHTQSATSFDGVFGHWIRFSLGVQQGPSSAIRQWSWSAVGSTTLVTHTGSHGPRAGRPATIANLFSGAQNTAPEGYSFGHVIVSTGTGALATVGQWTVPAEEGHHGEPAAQRVARLCAEEDVPVQIAGDAAASEPMGVQPIESLVDLLYEAAQADAGVIAEPVDGPGFTYRTRRTLENQAPVLDLDASTRVVAERVTSEVTHPLAPVLDDQRVRNDITLQRPRGGTINVVDRQSISDEGRYDDSSTLNVATDRQLHQHAGWALHLGTSPDMRLPSLTPDLNAAPHLIEAWLEVQLGDRASVVNLPSQYPVSGVDVLIEAWAETLSPDRWDVVLTCSPAEPWAVAVLDDGEDPPPDLTLQRLDTSGSELTAAVDATETGGWVVEIMDGSLWTTDSDYFPLDVALGGEVVTLSGIAGNDASAVAHGLGDFGTSASTSHVAPSLDAVGDEDLLICAWCSFDETGTYTVPASMGAGAETSGTLGTMRSAGEILASDGPTGTRTATFSASDAWAAVSVIVHRALPLSPVLEESLDGVQTGDPVPAITLTTDPSTEAGWLLVAMHAWSEDTAGVMGPPSGDGWTPVGDSAGFGGVPRVRVWAKRVSEPGEQEVVFTGPQADGSALDQHARLFALSGATSGVQTFTVSARSVNGVVKAHPARTPVHVANPVRLAL